MYRVVLKKVVYLQKHHSVQDPVQQNLCLPGPYLQQLGCVTIPIAVQYIDSGKNGSCTGARLSGTSCGKEKNMVEENIENVFLTPDDTPGAAVKNEVIGKLIVNQLKFWLECQKD